MSPNKNLETSPRPEPGIEDTISENCLDKHANTEKSLHKDKLLFKQNSDIDEFMRNTSFAPGTSPNYIAFSYFESLEGYNVCSYDERMTNKVISKEQINDVFNNLKKIENYNYMEMYHKMNWFNVLMIIISILIPIISLPIVCCLTKNVRRGFSDKAKKRCEEIKEC